jgi:uncharacterized membrane-anchored protein
MRKAMRGENVPGMDARYWLALLAASLFGTASGDFIAKVLDFGFLGGLIPFAILLAGVFVAERRARAPTEAYYWAAIVITRTAATNIADYSTHDLGLGTIATAAGLAALLVLALRAFARPGGHFALVADARYWLAVMIAGILGTVGGDAVSHAVGLADGLLAVAPLVGVILAWHIAARPTRTADYWIALVAVRITGTIGADFLASEQGLGMGLRWSMPLTGLILLGALMLPRRRPVTVEA